MQTLELENNTALLVQQERNDPAQIGGVKTIGPVPVLQLDDFKIEVHAKFGIEHQGHRADGCAMPRRETLESADKFTGENE